MRDEETNMLALVKGMERYVFLYTDDKAAEVLQQLGRFASNPELSFTWYDAVVVGVRGRSPSGPSQRTWLPAGSVMPNRASRTRSSMA